MEAVGAAASIIAIVELAAKTASICLEYSYAVKNAKEDILRLHNEIKSLEHILDRAQQLCNQADDESLSISQDTLRSLKDCLARLSTLYKKLKPAKRTKLATKLKLQELRWPFESKEVNKIIDEFERYKQAICLAFQLDQIKLIQNIGTKIDLGKLPSVEGAAFDSFSDQLDARCHQDTRVELRQQIRDWVEDSNAKPIYWLNGMAGTGKSTVSRTVAYEFAGSGHLGASFFFKRGDGDRGNAFKFFPTIVIQLIRKLPELSVFVQKAIQAEPAISSKTLKEQFEKLILQPLMDTKTLFRKPLLMVIDALDECENEVHVKMILHLLAQVQYASSVKLRILVTSRPDFHIRLGFKQISSVYQDFVLHEIPYPLIEHDITVFLRSELTRIREEYNSQPLSDQDLLPLDWPGQQGIQALVTMAVPLFIVAAIICRFIQEHDWDPRQRLTEVLQYQSASTLSQLEKTYLPVLDQQLTTSMTKIEKENRIREFCDVVGSIVLLFEPLSRASLANLLDLQRTIVDRRLHNLHSVLSVPDDSQSSVRLLHLSFREFLTNPEREGSQFWISESNMHTKLAHRCLDLLSTTDCLRQDICALKNPGTPRAEIDSHIITTCLPAEVQYACRHWVYHLKQGQCNISDYDQIHNFLEQRFLYWLEALSLIGRISDAITMVAILQDLIKPDSSMLRDFLNDARRFILINRSILDIVPLQLYSSAIIFAPETSIIRTRFKGCIPNWLGKLPNIQQAWSAVQQTLEGHSSSVTSVVFSPDGKQLASGSSDNTIKLWDAASGALQQTFDAGGSISLLSFRKDSSYLETNRGLVEIQRSQANVSSMPSQSTRSIFLKDDWIIRDTENLLWLSPEYRATASDWRDRVLALGHASGRVTFFEFSFDSY